MLGGVTVNPGVYIFVDTVNFLKITFLHIVGEYTKWLLRKHISIWGIYRYIRVRWSRIVFDLFLRRTPGVTGTPRIWISAHVGYICIIRTAYARRPNYIIYYYYLHRYRDGTYRDPHTYRCGTRMVCCKIGVLTITWLIPNQYDSLYRLAHVLLYTWMSDQHTCPYYRNNVHR